VTPLLYGLDIDELAQFLVTAKRHCYAAHSAATHTREPFGKERSFNGNDLFYLDRYYGSLREAGQETVWFRQVPVWSMVYIGGMLRKDEPLSSLAFSILRECLSLITVDAPYRGPKENIVGQWRYQCVADGDLLSFKGEEALFLDDELICTHYFLGGVISPKPSSVGR